MKNIVIELFPAVWNAKLWFEETLVDPTTNAVANQLKENKIHKWLYPYRQGYQLWRGLPMELMDEVDDDELVITVEGPLAAFQQIQQAFHVQREETDDIGFRHDAYRLIHRQKREVEDCKWYIAQIYKDCSTFLEIANQEDMLVQAAYEEAFRQAETFEQIYEVSVLMVKLLMRQLEAHQTNENYIRLFSEWLEQIKVEIWGE